MQGKVYHINVCICTFKRPHFLKRLLLKLKKQVTDFLFTYSIIVVDNDSNKSAEQLVHSFCNLSTFDIEIKYFVENEQNISLARNKAVGNSSGDFIAMIDDDEFPENNWLLELFKAYFNYNVDGVLGPVLPYYEIQPPAWIIKGKFHERSSHRTGEILSWRNCRTGNVLIRRDIFDDNRNIFSVEFGSGGEDRDFFKRMIKQGYQFVWSAEACVFEEIPPERCKRSFMLRRALLRGKTPYNHNIFAYFKTVMAIPLYTILVPFSVLLGQHVFMKYLIKYCDHIGRIFSLCRINLIKDKYVTK